MTTIQDVAKAAGVAPITVSRVLNNSGYASEDTRLRVEAAVKSLGYVPNTLARGLRSKRTQTLALVVTDITCNTDESELKEEKYINTLVQKQVDGVLLVPACSNVQSVKFLHFNDIP